MIYEMEKNAIGWNAIFLNYLDHNNNPNQEYFSSICVSII